MKKRSLDDYKLDIKVFYEEARKGDIFGLLDSPSPGNLKKLCVIKAGSVTHSDDKEILKRFFDCIDGDLVRQIEASDTDKLRPATNYLKGKTSDTQQLMAELIAILIDFQPRPYNKYAGIAKHVPEAAESGPAKESDEKKLPPIGVVFVPSDEAKANNLPAADGRTIEGVGREKGKNQAEVLTAKRPQWQLYAVVGLILFIILAGFKLLYKEKNCLTWKTDHYELVDCEGNYPIVPYREELLKFRKIEVSDTTTFFKNGRPVVWYSKQDNDYAFFNADGENPITGKDLKPISRHIIEILTRKK